MQISSVLKEMAAKIFDGLFLTREEIICLLKMNDHSVDAGFIMAMADAISRKTAKGQAEVHAQIGLNLSPCPKDCSFCSFAEGRSGCTPGPFGDL
jgi:biotin synthase